MNKVVTKFCPISSYLRKMHNKCFTTQNSHNCCIVYGNCLLQFQELFRVSGHLGTVCWTVIWLHSNLCLQALSQLCTQIPHSHLGAKKIPGRYWISRHFENIWHKLKCRQENIFWLYHYTLHPHSTVNCTTPKAREDRRQAKAVTFIPMFFLF